MSEEIIKLSDFAHIRARPMYLGSRDPHTQEVILYDKNFNPFIQSQTWVPALFTAFREALDNAVDEAIKGFGNKIEINYNPDNLSFSVRDHGRGIPIEWDNEHNCHKATLALAEPRAGRNFGEREDQAGQNGIGITAVNMSSTWFKADVWRDGVHFHQYYEEDIEKNEHKVHEPIVVPYAKKDTGTQVQFKLSTHVFEIIDELRKQNIHPLPIEFVRSKVFEAALSRPNITFIFNGETFKVKKESVVFNSNLLFEINEENFTSRWLLVPNFIKEGDFYQSTVNGIPVFNGGPHLDSFRRSFYKNFLNELESLSKRKKVTPNKSDISEGLLIFNITTMKAPNFNSQDKARLTNEEAGKIVTKFFEQDNNAFWSMLKRQSVWIDEIFERAAKRQNIADKDEEKKLAKTLSRKKIPKLMDATSRTRQNCKLLLGEGDSSVGALSSVRDPEVFGGLPLRGKVLNVHEETLKTVSESQALVDIMTATGLSIGQIPTTSNVRYGQLWIATDADQDGASINNLLVNFLYKYWPSLFHEDSPMQIYSFMTPYIIAEKGKVREYWYADNYDEFIPENYKGWSITRAKGLGTLEKQDWKHSLGNPRLKRFLDDGNLKESLDLMFNKKRANDRKDWMAI